MGQEQSTPNQTPVVGAPNPEGPPQAVVSSTSPTAASKCPVSRLTSSDQSQCPMHSSGKKEGEASKDGVPIVAASVEQPKQQESGKSECPVAYKNPNVYNVYNQKIDPTNQMPAQANQAPAPGQTSSLSVHREPSSIPKGGTESTWVYPSPQMFWNALVRKEKVEGASEEDMESVVRIHNSMNEATWLKVLEWENLHPVTGPGREPKLLRFLGRPDELSPKAKLKVWIAGCVEPFDRHDWIVDRGGTEVRYVIDYYHDEAGAPQDKTPQNKHDLASVKSIKLDVRPALDSPTALFDRLILMPYYRLTGQSTFRPLPFFPESATVIAERKQLEKMQNSWEIIRKKCEVERQKLTNCKSDKECANATIALQACTASVVCPTIEKDFKEAIAAQPFDEEKTEKVYTSLVKCLELFEIDSKNAFSKKK